MGDAPRRPSFLPEARQFSQADPRVVQRPEGTDALDAKGVKVSDPDAGNLRKYAEIQASPGRWDEAFPLTAVPQFSGGGQVILLEKDLGFTAKSFLVDNYTNQWLYEPNLKRFIPPYSGGWVLMAPNGYQMARVQLKSPPFFTQPAALAGEFVWMGWHEAALPPATGVVIGGSLAPSGAAEVVITDDTGAELLLSTAAILGSTSATGSLPTTTPGEWSITNAPIANTIATITRAAAGGVRHVARTITGDLVSNALPAAVAVTLVLRDGATGVGAIVWSRYLALQAVAGDKDDTQSGGTMNIVGTLGNAMTLEFTAAGGAATLEAVSLTGYDAT